MLFVWIVACSVFALDPVSRTPVAAPHSATERAAIDARLAASKAAVSALSGLKRPAPKAI